MLASLICSFSSSSSSLPWFSLQCLQFWKKSKTRITWQLPASRQRREQCGGCRTGRASSWGWAASAPSSAWSPGSPGAGWVHNSWPFDATWSLLVEKTSWKVESAMSGVIPITSFFKLRQALSKRTRRGSGQGQEMENCKLVICPQNKSILFTRSDIFIMYWWFNILCVRTNTHLPIGFEHFTQVLQPIVKEARLRKVDFPPAADLIKAPMLELWEENSEKWRNIETARN